MQKLFTPSLMMATRFFLDKKDVTKNQLEACQRILPYVSEMERGLVEKEILELKMVLDLIQ